MRTHRWLAVLLLGLCLGLPGTAQAGPWSWLWPFGKPTPAKKPVKPKPRTPSTVNGWWTRSGSVIATDHPQMGTQGQPR
jgi:hypothetical protein